VIGAVVLAAGAGRRLGGVAKALLRTDATTYLERIVTTARAASVEHIVVVVGPPWNAVVRAEASRLDLDASHVVENPEPDRGMASSIALGFRHLIDRSRDVVAAYLWPVDHPFVRAETARALHDSLGEHAAARPRYRARGGHPPLIARDAWPALASCERVDGGARAVLATLDVIDVEVDDPGVVRDVDVPADLEARS
jgi:molybdenum cofactor cytidylyltransferase